MFHAIHWELLHCEMFYYFAGKNLMLFTLGNGRARRGSFPFPAARIFAGVENPEGACSCVMVAFASALAGLRLRDCV